MKINKFIRLIFIIAISFEMSACKDQLQVGNPNAPSLSSITDEAGITSLALGGVYISGFVTGNKTYSTDSYFALNYGYSELMGDHLGADALTAQIGSVNIPNLVTLSDGITTVKTTSSTISFLRKYNTRDASGAGNNILYYQWLNNYSLNNACNVVLANLPSVKWNPMTINPASKLNTFRAWCYWWKGWAYASIGSMYYSGLLIDEISAGDVRSITNSNYVLHDAIIANSNKYYLKADSVLKIIGPDSNPDYQAVMQKLIPSFFQQGQGRGNPPTVSEWRRNIQTMLARNILVNKLSPFVNGNLNARIEKSSTTTMTNADWTAVLNYAAAGVMNGDNVFSGFAATANTVFTSASGTVASLSAGSNASTLFKISERLVQNFKSGDRRLQNFTQYYNGASSAPTIYVHSFFGTRWSLYSSDQNPPPPGVVQLANRKPLAYQCYIGTSYEENALMRAEANIRLGNVDAGLAFIDAVRIYQGAGIAAVSGTGLTPVQGMKELTMERQVALVFRGLAFYDARRWGWIYDVSNGGGSYGNNFLYLNPSTGKTTLDTNATINYNFLDYWDVPADESELNPPAGVATVNPNF